MNPPSYHREYLTGRARGRMQRLTGKVVMQVEIQVESCTFADLISPKSGSNETPAGDRQAGGEPWKPYRTYWRDATSSDAFPAAVFNQSTTDS